MRARNIKPDFFSDDELAELHPLARILFAGLWCQADRDGRMKDRPKKLKSLILPFDKCDVDALLGSLSPKFITRYQDNGCRYIQVVTFDQHQNPHKNEKSCNYPAPPEESSNYESVPVITGAIGMIDDTGLMKEERGNKPSRDSGYTPDFESFWSQYPKERRKEKAGAFSCWKARLKEGVSIDDLVQAARAYANECRRNDVDPQFIKLPATFLSAKKRPFEDYIPQYNPLSRFGEDEARDLIRAGRLKREEDTWKLDGEDV